MTRSIFSYLFVFLCLSLVNSTLTAQDTSPTHAIRLVFDNTFEWNRQVVADQSEISLLRPSISLSKYRANGDFHEIYLSDFGLGRSQNKSNATDSNGEVITVKEKRVTILSDVGYGYNKIIGKSSLERRLKPYVGLHLRSQFSGVKTKSTRTETYVSRSSAFLTDLALYPRVVYTLKKRLLLDLGLPITVVQNWSTIRFDDNPVAFIEDRRVYTSDLEILPLVLQLRVGLGLTF